MTFCEEVARALQRKKTPGGPGGWGATSIRQAHVWWWSGGPAAGVSQRIWLHASACHDHWSVRLPPTVLPVTLLIGGIFMDFPLSTTSVITCQYTFHTAVQCEMYPFFDPSFFKQERSVIISFDCSQGVNCMRTRAHRLDAFQTRSCHFHTCSFDRICQFVFVTYPPDSILPRING